MDDRTVEKILSVDLSLIQVNKKEWNDFLRQPPTWSEYKTYENLQQNLTARRKDSLNSKTIIVEAENKQIRVFPHSENNIDFDISDVFARGLDFARAATEILNNASTDTSALSQLTLLLDKFQQNMSIKRHNKEKQLQDARNELERFNGALVDLLINKSIIKKRSEAIQAINFVRDFLWKKDICMPICVIEHIKDSKSKMLRYTEPMMFEDPEFKRRNTNGNINVWDNDQPWKTKLYKAVGVNENSIWFKSFLEKNLNQMKKISSTPMSRYTPNPANAFFCTDLIVDLNNEITYSSSHERVAVTEPLSVSDTKSCQEVTDWNHLQLFSKAHLKYELNNFMGQWGDVIGDNKLIPFTILHQTLISDEVTFSPDQIKARASKVQASVIDSKSKANAAVRRMLENSTILRERSTGNIEFISNKKFDSAYNKKIPEGWQKVTIELLETNNGINMWSARTRVRNNDYDDARKLIESTKKMFENVSENNKHLKTVLDFLSSPNHSLFTPFKFRGSKVKEAIKNLTLELRNGDSCSHLSKKSRENIALSLHAAIELKCTIHETWLGSFRRNITNFTRDYVRQVPVSGHLIDWTIRGALTLAAVGLKAIVNIFTSPFSLPQWIKHRGDRREMYKSTYEGVLAESLGVLRGGCMSSADRALEQAEQRAMIKKQFSIEGKIISYNDSREEKARVYRTYGGTRTKHACVENATGTAGTSDKETRGMFFNARAGILSHIAETPEEQHLAMKLSALRKGRFSDGTVSEYLSGKFSPADIRTIFNNSKFKECGDPIETYGAIKIHPYYLTNNAIVIPPSTDTQSKIPKLQTIGEGLKNIKGIIKKHPGKKIYIPVAEEQKIFGIFKRNHWVTLEYDPLLKKATLLDSRPKELSFIYPCRAIKRQLKEGLFSLYGTSINFSFEKKYQGVQHNDIHCGAWTCTNILDLAGAGCEAYNIDNQKTKYKCSDESTVVQSYTRAISLMKIDSPLGGEDLTEIIDQGREHDRNLNSIDNIDDLSEDNFVAIDGSVAELSL
ncbi:hypothetical protein [Legionella sainthelensi]|uniref:hypothetical protein n=1 Tax=Legionella sainthelensi TaxID=28087 RepID=UPI000E20957A|nr:hypothetical protein [Legionella sainthelensi]